MGNSQQTEELKAAAETPDIVYDLVNLPAKELKDRKSVIEIKKLKKEYPLAGGNEVVTALHEINVFDSRESEFPSIKKGEFLMLRGPSGCGKTTLLNIIGTIDHLSSGTIEIDGKLIDNKSTDKFLSELRLEKIGFVFQTFNLLAALTVKENVELPMRILGKLKEEEIKERCMSLLKSVGLQERINHLPSELSGGEQQRVAIARALSNHPEILLLDEPTGDLDTFNSIEVMNLLLRFNNYGYDEKNKDPVTMVMATHNPDVEVYADRIIYIKDGKIEKQVRNRRQSILPYEAYLEYLKESNKNQIQLDD